jgi:hypothetical protein
MMPPAALICAAAALHEFCAFRPKKAFCPVNACSTPAVTGYVPPPEVGELAPETPAGLPDPLDEHPAAAIEAMAAAADATSHRFLISVIAYASVHSRSRNIA